MSQVLPVDEWMRSEVDKFLDYHDVLALNLMVNGISSLQPKACTFVFCQFTSSPRDVALLGNKKL